MAPRAPMRVFHPANAQPLSNPENAGRSKKHCRHSAARPGQLAAPTVSAEIICRAKALFKILSTGK